MNYIYASVLVMKKGWKVTDCGMKGIICYGFTQLNDKKRHGIDNFSIRNFTILNQNNETLYRSILGNFTI